MKNKKIFMYICIIVIISIIIGIGYLIYINIMSKKEEKILKEYIPEEEISDSQLRMTNIELYYLNNTTNTLEKEIREIDAKLLVENPAQVIMEELNKKPETETLNKLIPENTKINNVKIEKGVVYLDFSEEFINDENMNNEKEKMLIESIKKSMAQLLEINSIKISINGINDSGFVDGTINFSENIKIGK